MKTRTVAGAGKTATLKKDPIRLLAQMNIAIDKLDTTRFRLIKEERVRGEFKRGEMSVKFARDPKRLYIYLHEPRKCTELLWLEGDKKALVRNGSFPKVTLKISLFNAQMLDGNHHPVSHTSFCYFADVVTHLQRKYKEEADKLIQYQGTDEHDGKLVHVLEMDNPYYEVFETNMEEDTKLIDLSYQDHLSAYKLHELNRVPYDYKLKKGRKVRLTNDYAAGMRLKICDETALPLFLEVMDEEGLFQRYEFYDVEVNPDIKDEEFTRNYPDYNF